MKRIQQTAIPVIARSHPGSTGKNNEDRFAVSAFRDETRAQTPILLAVISDGIGGHRGGEIASEMTVNQISQYLAEADISNPLQSLQDAIHYASNRVFQEAESENGSRGMGATVAAAWVIGNRLYTSHVGDSRIYLLRNHQLHQLSLDHSWVQEAIQLGVLTPEEAKKHPNAHVIRRYLGSPKPPLVDQRLFLDAAQSDEQAIANQGLVLKPGDRILLTTDGITDLLNQDELLKLFDGTQLQSAVDQGIAQANELGGFDNLSLIAFEIPVREAWFERTWPRLMLLLGLILFFLLLLSLVWISRIHLPGNPLGWRLPPTTLNELLEIL